MSLTIVLSEIWRFIKKSIGKIIIGATIIGILGILSNLFLPNIMRDTSEGIMGGEQTQSIEYAENLQESQEYLSRIYEQEPAGFEFYVQLEDGNNFINSFIFDEYFTSPSVVEKIENETGIRYSHTLDHEENIHLYKTSSYRGSIAGIRDTSSNVITLRVHVAEKSKDNLALAEAFASMIANDEIPIVENLQVTLLRSPSIGEKLGEEDLEMVSSPATFGTFAPTESESQSLALYGIAAFIVGLLLTTIVLFIIQLFKDKITYAFQYSWDFDDYHVLYNSENEKKQLKEILYYPEMNCKIIVHQNNTLVEKNLKNINHIMTTNSLMHEPYNKNQPDQIILIVESKITDKEWYNKQYRLAKMFESPLMIIHIVT